MWKKQEICPESTRLCDIHTTYEAPFKLGMRLKFSNIQTFVPLMSEKYNYVIAKFWYWKETSRVFRQDLWDKIK